MGGGWNKSVPASEIWSAWIFWDAAIQDALVYSFKKKKKVILSMCIDGVLPYKADKNIYRIWWSEA